MFKRSFILIMACLISLQASAAAPFKQTCPGSGALCAPPPPPSCSYTPPLDQVSTGALGAYSFRLLKTTYSGGNIVTIQRSSDSTQKTFTATLPSCGLNTADAFFDGSTYTLVTWYDQSGAGNNVTQGANANRPTITLSCQNGHPCAVFASASSQVLNATLGAGVAATTLTAVANITSQASSHGIVEIGDASGGTDGTNLLWSTGLSTCQDARIVSGTSFRGQKACANNTWFRFTGTSNNSVSSIYLNGVIGTNESTATTLSNQTHVYIGKAATVFMTGDISEAILYAPDLSSADSGTVSTNQGSYWGI